MPRAQYNYNTHARHRKYEREKDKKQRARRLLKDWPSDFRPRILEEWPLEIANELPWACTSFLSPLVI